MSKEILRIESESKTYDDSAFESVTLYENEYSAELLDLSVNESETYYLDFEEAVALRNALDGWIKARGEK
jgi:hypothetical protein